MDCLIIPGGGLPSWLLMQALEGAVNLPNNDALKYTPATARCWLLLVVPVPTTQSMKEATTV
eukprot:scaffold233675_cov17-Prasinocladus_malaysianus.AAC.1